MRSLGSQAIDQMGAVVENAIWGLCWLWWPHIAVMMTVVCHYQTNAPPWSDDPSEYFELAGVNACCTTDCSVYTHRLSILIVNFG